MALRASRRLLLGQYSRMLDLGGMPHASTSSNLRTVKDASKNSKVQAIAFDFHLLTRSVENQKAETATTTAPSKTAKLTEPVLPDVTMVQNIANLLNVNLGGTNEKKDMKHEDDDLSTLLSGEESASLSASSDSSINPLYTQKEDEQLHNNKKKKDSSSVSSLSDFFSKDVRSRYADKLRHKLESGGGSLAGMDRARYEREEALKHGDATSHLAARAMAASTPSTTPSFNKKWLATTGAGTLLSYVTHRSIKVALLPIPGCGNPKEEGERMEDFCQQLSHNVSFDLLVKEGKVVKDILDKVLTKVDVAPMATLVVSDRDDYLKGAKECGMITCRIRPVNARQGNITAHYNVPSVAQVQDVVNEINGISFNAVFAAGKSA